MEEKLIFLPGYKNPIIMIDNNKEFTFTKCKSFDNCIEYTKKGIDLDEKELLLLRAELEKNKDYELIPNSSEDRSDLPR